MTAQEAIVAVQTRPRAAAARKRPATTWETWHGAWLGTFGGTPCPVWSRTDDAIAAKLKSRVSVTKTDFAEWLAWCVCHWRTICAQQFAWMTKAPPPRYPNLRFLTKFSEAFLNAYALAAESEDSMTPGDDAFIRRLIASGKTRDEAMLELGKQRGVAEQRIAIAKERAEASKVIRTAQETLRRLERTTPVVPIRQRPRAPQRAVQAPAGAAVQDDYDWSK